jgi:hypothetical protein
MKKLTLTVITLAAVCASPNVFGQATVIFNNRITGTLVTHVYSFPDEFGGGLRGNGPGDTPTGTTTYGAGYTLIGTVGGLSASTTFAQLLGAPGFNQPESSLLPAQGVTSFRTGAAAGTIAGITATFNNIPPNAPAATLEMVAWDNSSGLYPTWAQASIAWVNGLTMAGRSGTWNQDNMGDALSAPNMINSTDPSQHLQSFGFGVPEPATATLASLGAVALLVFRRYK